MRILTGCAGGNCRSVTLATLLKYAFRDPTRHPPSAGYDALACALEKNDRETLRMLFWWADRVITVDEETFGRAEEIIKDLALNPPHKRTAPLNIPHTLIPIGQDKWGQSMHEDLVPYAHRLLVDAGYEARLSAAQIIARGTKYAMRRQGVDGGSLQHLATSGRA